MDDFDLDTDLDAYGELDADGRGSTSAWPPSNAAAASRRRSAP